jgi:hypothetical protein
MRNILFLLLIPVFAFAQKPSAMFEELWKTLDENYVFFEQKKVDWKAIGAKYRPQVSDTLNEHAIFKLCSDMLAELGDYHVMMSSKKGITMQSYESLDYPKGFDIQQINAYYFARKGGLNTCGPFYYQQLDSSFSYVYYPSFGSRISHVTMDSLCKKVEKSKALILDLRDNEGGDASNMFRLVSHFIKKRTKMGYIFTKKGKKNHSDLDKGEKVWVEPVLPIWTKPVYILLSDLSYSSTTICAAMLSQLDHVTLVGTKSGGGTGLPVGIRFDNGWTCRFPNAFFVLNDKKYIESGIEPDLVVPHDVAENGRDALLEYLLLKIKM